MIIPAAGSGSRLGASVPKLMVEINGRPMLDHLLALYAPVVDSFVVVCSPVAETMVRGHLAGAQVPVDVVVQAEPTGMLDAILLPAKLLEAQRPLQVWVTWCDQVAIRPATVQRVTDALALAPAAELVLPTIRREQPYIHFERDDEGVIRHILHRRENDVMPATGESDMGLFVMSDSAYYKLLPRFAESVEAGKGTGERNFLPFIVWMGDHGGTLTLAGTHYMESIGINTPAERALVEEWLRDG
jgi:bifunctional N-acetylglucosamine-1-phosphate-uridyltransferase/glucosamine-1-phosphate-acetyltransferase GlmU-like protein